VFVIWADKVRPIDKTIPLRNAPRFQINNNPDAHYEKDVGIIRAIFSQYRISHNAAKCLHVGMSRGKKPLTGRQGSSNITKFSFTPYLESDAPMRSHTGFDFLGSLENCKKHVNIQPSCILDIPMTPRQMVSTSRNSASLCSCFPYSQCFLSTSLTSIQTQEEKKPTHRDPNY